MVKDLSVSELKELCREKKLSGYSKLNKAELIKLCSKASKKASKKDVDATYVLKIINPTKAYKEYVLSDLKEYFNILKVSGNTIYLGKNLKNSRFDDDELFQQMFNVDYNWWDDPQVPKLDADIDDENDDVFSEFKFKNAPRVEYEIAKGSTFAKRKNIEELEHNKQEIKNIKQEIKRLETTMKDLLKRNKELEK